MADHAYFGKGDSILVHMSHDLRLPLNMVIGNCQILMAQSIGPLNARQVDCVNDILTGTRHLLELLNDILDISRSESGQLKLALAEIDMPRLVHNSLRLVRPQAGERGIVLDTDIDEQMPFVVADGKRILQVLVNLLSNAIKFTPGGGRAGIRASWQDSHVCVEVWDTGIGIAPEHQPLLFRPYERLEDKSTASPYPGFGLGLALCKQLIELHGGTIGVQSDGAGYGSMFWFTLPSRSVPGLDGIEVPSQISSQLDA